MSELERACARVLRDNWTEGVRSGARYSYTRPSPHRYPFQWYWDSCFAAIAWRRHEPVRARAELETLLAAQREDGFIGHTIVWEDRLRWPWTRLYNVRSPADRATATIQPPLLAWAWLIAVGHPASEPRIAAHHEWLLANRDLSGDGLLWIVQPDESGLDASPKFDPVWGRRAHARPGFPALVRRNRRLGWDARAVLAAGGPVVCEVVTNVLWGLSLLAMGRESITPAIVERLYDRERGLFLDLVRPSGARPAVATWAALAPLALPDLPESIGRTLVERHLLDPAAFWLPLPPSSVSAREPAFSRGDGRGPVRRYWRGPTWVNSAWLLSIGLARLGYRERAREMAEALSAVVLREGLREYYDPYTGSGLGATDFAWTSLVLEMAAPVVGRAG